MTQTQGGQAEPLPPLGGTLSAHYVLGTLHSGIEMEHQ